MEKILVPVDFSEHTDKTCQYALEIAKRFNSEIRLFHSYFDQVIVSDSSFPTGIDTNTMMNEQLLIDIEKRAKLDIQELQSKLIDQVKHEKIKDIKIVYTLVGGDPENEIVSLCEEYKPDIIIMGSSGKGNKGILMGSVSKKVMNNAKVPVLAIPETFSYSGINKIMYATEFNDADSNIIKKLLNMFSSFNIKINCVHLNLDNDKTVDNKMMDNLKRIFAEENNNGIIHFEIIDCDKIAPEIENYVTNNQIDIIAFLSQKRNIFQKLFKNIVTKKHLFEAGVPLLAFHG